MKGIWWGTIRVEITDLEWADDLSTPSRDAAGAMRRAGDHLTQAAAR